MNIQTSGTFLGTPYTLLKINGSIIFLYPRCYIFYVFRNVSINLEQIHNFNSLKQFIIIMSVRLLIFLNYGNIL